MTGNFDDFLRAYKDKDISEKLASEINRRVGNVEDEGQLLLTAMDFVLDLFDDELRAYHEWITRGTLPS